MRRTDRPVALPPSRANDWAAILRVSLVMRLARPTRIRFPGQRLPYHQNAQTRRARADRGTYRTNSSLRESCRCLIGAKSRNLAGEFAKQKSQRRETGQILSSWRREWDSNPRYGFPYTRFPSVRLKPLGHPSARLRPQYSPARSSDKPACPAQLAAPRGRGTASVGTGHCLHYRA
jgi:hypothetical protein